jgi:glycosyltransferase involved in cell wall biosynthesis
MLEVVASSFSDAGKAVQKRRWPGAYVITSRDKPASLDARTMGRIARSEVIGPRVAVFHVGTALYRQAFFEEVARRGVDLLVVDSGTLDPTVLSQKVDAGSFQTLHLTSSHTWRWRRDVLQVLDAFQPDVSVIQHGASLDFSWPLLLWPTRSARAIWGHGIEQRERFTGKVGLGGLLRSIQIRLADGILCYEEETADLLRRRFPQKVIGFARNSTDGEAMTSAVNARWNSPRTEVKQQLGLTHEFHLLGLGRLVRDKRFDLLADVLVRVRASGLSAGCIIVGDGPEKKEIGTRVESRGLTPGKDVIFTGSVRDTEELAKWLYVSDVCVNPGYLGLSVVDCLFAGVPIVSVAPGPKGPFHSPEWIYISTNVTGWLAEEQTDSSIANLVIAYLRRGSESRDCVRSACIRTAQETLGIGKMADGFLRFIEEMVATRQAARGTRN